MLDPFFAELSDGICVSDPRGLLMYVNPAARAFLGCGEGADLCEHLCGRFVAGEGGGWMERCAMRQAGSPSRGVDVRGLRGAQAAGEQARPLRVRCLRMVTSLYDSWETEKKFTIIEDASLEAELERRKQDWIRMIAHDVRSPLTSVLGILLEIENSPPDKPLEPGLRSMVAISTRSCRRMNSLIGLFLDLARLEDGAWPSRVQPVLVSPLLSACVEELSALARERRIVLTSAGAPDLEAVADPALLFRVAQNLIGNALKFTPEGGRISVTAAKEDGVVAILVRDSGPGIAPEDLPRLFDRFYQGRGVVERRTGGYGLGLAFCQEAVKAMGGEIRAEPADAGAAFVVTLRASPPTFVEIPTIT